VADRPYGEFFLFLQRQSGKFWINPRSVSKWQMGFNSAFKGVSGFLLYILLFIYFLTTKSDVI
jgi:hypothetical protein